LLAPGAEAHAPAALHTANDRLSAVHAEPYYRSYLLVATYLAELDARLE
jgi:hypothetical protein